MNVDEVAAALAAGPLALTEAVGKKRAGLVAEEFVLVVHVCLNVSC